jgi:hypothetical protein
MGVRARDSLCRQPPRTGGMCTGSLGRQQHAASDCNQNRTHPGSISLRISYRLYELLSNNPNECVRDCGFRTGPNLEPHPRSN